MKTMVINSEFQSIKKIKVSVIIPCFNQQHYLQQALNSLADQQYPELEVIVIDDGSTETVKLPEANWPFELVIFHQANQGLAAARNQGLQLATGELIKFLDADDVLLPGCLLAQVPTISNTTDMVSLIGFVDYSLKTKEKREIIPAFSDPLEALLLQNIAPVHSYLFSRKSIELIGGFSTDKRTKGGCEDYDLLLRLVAAGVGLVTVHRLGVVYYRYTESMSTQNDNMKKTRAAVWSYTAQTILANAHQLSGSQASALLYGWWQLLSCTPTAHQEPLLLCRQLIITAIEQGLLAPEKTELTLLHEKLVTHEEGKLVAEAIARRGFVETRHLHIPVQAIIDRRLKLQEADQAFNENWLCEVFISARVASGQFGIYGAGEMGQRLGRLLKAAGIVPQYYIDRAASKESHLDGIPVITPDALASVRLKLIIIASARFFNDIKSNLDRIKIDARVL